MREKKTNTTVNNPIHNPIVHETTRSLCPECRQVVAAQVLIHDGAVYLRKHCPQHGWHEALVSSDSDWYLNSLKYNKPGAIPQDFATAVEQGCPFDCGLCPEHQQHTCVSIIEITTRCNLSCPVCFANAENGYDLSLKQVESILDRLLKTESEPEIVQLSGGEPTVHPQFLEIIAAVKNRGIRHVMFNTNGLRLAQEPDFARQIAPFQPTVYLQFDGLTASAYQKLRGHDLRAIKEQALSYLTEAGLYTVLVPTVVLGINDNEIGDILRYGLDHPAVLGVNYQPATFSGRCLIHKDPLRRVTVPDILHALETQTHGLFRVNDFRPVPCPHPVCSACTYAFVNGDQIIPVPRLVEVDDYLDFVTNRSLPNLSAELQPALETLWSMASVAGSDKTTDALTCIVCDRAISLTSKSKLSAKNFFVIQVHGFMDEHNFDIKRLMKCCVHQLLPDGRTIPFCAYNNLGYREQVNMMLTGEGEQ